MKDKASYHNGGVQTLGLPLDLFFTALQRSGIGVTPAQIAEANKLMLQYAPSIQDEAALCQYLCPLFATNLAEQERFKEIFAAQFTQNETLPPIPPPLPPPNAWWKYRLALLPVLLLVGWFIWKSQIRDKAELSFYFSLESQYTGGGGNDDGLYQFVAGDTLQANLTPLSKDTALAKRVVVKAKYNWGDNSALDSSGSHVFRNSGTYITTIWLDTYDKNKLRQRDTIVKAIYICDFDPSFEITSTAQNDTTPLLKPMLLTAGFDSLHPPSHIKWSIDAQRDGGNVNVAAYGGFYPDKKSQRWDATAEGAYTVTCTAMYDSVGGPCSYTATTVIYAHDPNKPQMAATLKPAPNAKALKPNYQVKKYWFWIFGGGLLLCIALSSFFWRRYRRLQRARQATPIIDSDYEAWLATLDSAQPSASIPFLNKNALAPPEPAMATVGRLMRRRIAGEAMYMHIGKTIAKAVRNSGFFRPIMEPRTQQSEYLLLIEESHINSQLTKLFDYLADTLHRHNVFVEKYYYRYAPSLCYNAAVPNGISLEKLSEKYPNHILVIAGHGHQLIYPYQPMVSHSYQSLLARWKHRAILTPLPFADWGDAEKDILPTVIPVFPADTTGHLLMMQAMADSRMDVQQQLREQQGNFYAAADVDCKDVDELAAYCQLADWANSKDGNPYSNRLFQWIAALAVYPKLQWELTLSIGKALLDKAGLGHQLNYTSLLHLARISWMQEGMMPPELRLELLKQLKQENEVLARETILFALNEIPTTELKPGHAAYEEKELQRIINEFNLYAYDPVKYAAYGRSRSIFERLWSDNKLTEASIKKYLRNPNAQWPTLINNRLADGPTDAAYVPLDEYFKPLPPLTKGLAKLFKALGVLAALLVGVSILGLIGMVALQLTNSKRFPLFTQQKDQLYSIGFTIKDSATNKVGKEIFVRVGDSSITFTKSSSLRLPLSDSAWPVAISVNNKAAYDSFMPIDRTAYEVVVSDRVEPGSSTRVVFNLGPDCGDNFETINRYRQWAQSVAKGLTIVMGPASGRKNKAGTCVNSIQVGQNLSNDLVDKLVERFKQEGLTLIRDAALDATTPDGEIYITSVAEAERPTQYAVTLKPVIYLQVSNASMLTGAEIFRKRLIGKGYQVNKTTVKNWSYDSEIYYYDKIVANDAQAIQRLYRSYNPAMPLEAKLRNTNDSKPNDNRIVVWMKKLERDSDGTDSKQDEKQPGSSFGKRVVKIAQREIGNGETPPGSNKTKYGEWFNAKMNEAGLSWSPVFVSWVYDQAGQPLYLERGGSGFSSFTSLLQYAKRGNLLTTEPQPGDIVVIDLPSSSYHGGIFVKWLDKESGKFETVEGNVAKGVSKNGEVGKGVRSTKTAKIYFVHVNPSAQQVTSN